MGTNIHYVESIRIQKFRDEMKVWLKNLEFRGALRPIATEFFTGQGKEADA